MPTDDHYTTQEAARILGLAVRSIQLMVDRGELDAWKTPGGHRRITRESVERWRASRSTSGLAPLTAPAPVGDAPSSTGAPFPAELDRRRAAAPQPPVSHAVTTLLIEDSSYYQNLVSLLFKQKFPQVRLVHASDGISGLALFGKLEPQLLLVDILLPGIDGATLITTLRSHPQFSHCHLIVVTSLDAEQRKPYAFALEGVTVVQKTRLVEELPALVAAAIAEAGASERAA